MRGSRSALPWRGPLRIAAPPSLGYAGSMNHPFHVLVLLAVGLSGCGTPAPSDTAGDSGDTAPACNPPADGVLPVGSWESDKSGAFNVEEDGSIFYYACLNVASVAEATITGGAVDWATSWHLDNSPDTGNHWEGRTTGTFCADTATLTWAPLETAPTTYRRVSPDEMPDMCD